MRIEVLQRGEKPGDRTYTVVCRECHSHLRFKASDATAHADPRDGDFLSISCPVCDATVNVQAMPRSPDRFSRSPVGGTWIG